MEQDSQPHAPVLAFRGVTLSFFPGGTPEPPANPAQPVLAGVDWEVGPGERWVVLGANGSGKTSLLRLAGGWLFPTTGTVDVLGHRLGRVDVRTLRRRLGYASGALVSMLRPSVTGLEVVMAAKHAALETWWHTYDDADRARARALLERMGCGHLADRAVSTASDGERQRIQLARTLMGTPDLLLLDEPTAGLDLGGREALVARLADLAADPEAPATVLVTHHTEEIPPGFSHALLLRAGRVLAAGPLDETLTAAALSACFDTPVTLERRAGRFIALARTPMTDAMTYPGAPRQDIVEEIHGHAVADPYRWLEDADDPATRAWSKAQDELVRPFLDRQPDRDALASRLRELSVGLVTPPTVRGDRFFLLRRHPDQEHAVLVVLTPGDDPLTGGRVLIDPSALSDDDTITLDGWLPSNDGTLLAYLLSDAGTEESTLQVMDVETAELVDGPIDRCRYSALAWTADGTGLYYVRRLPPEAVPTGEESFHRRVWFRRLDGREWGRGPTLRRSLGLGPLAGRRSRQEDAVAGASPLGADPGTDELVFGDGRDPTAYYSVDVSHDGRWLLLAEHLGTAPRNDVWIADLAAAEGHRRLVPIHEGLDAATYPHVGPDGRLYLHTNLGAPRYRLAVTDPEDPQPEHWRDLLPEGDGVLTDWCLPDETVVAVRAHHGVSMVTVHDTSSGDLTQVALPGLGVASVTTRPEGGSDVWIGYQDFTTPSQVWHHDLPADTTGLWAGAPGSPDLPPIVTDQIPYRSADGAEVRMFVIHRSDVDAATGPHPTVLYGYGGFQVSQVPAYSATVAAWVERGGVWVVACIRGGSEEGEDWHRDGMREHKQHCFDDFIAAGETLIAAGWTDAAHLGIYGGSNGGLLVGATLTQRPDLMAAVVCSAPLLDMVRYERFGLGRTWNDEYGTAADPEELGWLLSYSPYHRVVEGTAYPTVLFTVFDNDTRVDPLHARKLCAALQHATSRSPEEAPILLRREENVGHGGRSISRTVGLAADILGYFTGTIRTNAP